MGITRLIGMPLVSRPFAQISALDEIARTDSHNIAPWERKASVVLGGILGLTGIMLRSRAGILVSLLGGALIYRGQSGKCELYRAVGINTALPNPDRGVTGDKGINVKATTLIQRPAGELFHYWRDLANLPQFMPHVISVDESAEGISHWKVRGPLRTELEWDSEIIEEQPGKMLSWRTLPGAQIASAGTVRFNPTQGGTEVTVSLQYAPPAGAVGNFAAKILGASPQTQVSEDLARFRELMES